MDDMILVNVTCPFCGKVSALWVKDIAYRSWQDGALIQDAFPLLSPTEREMLKTGMCEVCQKEIFGD